MYLITNMVNGKTYVGITTRFDLRTRMREHVCSALHNRHNGALTAAIRKYGRELFDIHVIARFDTASDAELAEREYIAVNEPAYNANEGGGGRASRSLSAQERRNISIAKRGNTYRRGSTHTPQARELLRQAAIKNTHLFDKYRQMGPAAVARTVRCVNDGSVWCSASEAARAYDVAKSAVIELCLGKRGRKTVGGRVFEYAEVL